MTGPAPISPSATTHAVLERRRHTWRWVLLGACLLVVGGIGAFTYSVIRYAGHDLPELIDDPVVVSTVDTACTSMTAEVARLTVAPGATWAQRADSVRKQNAAVHSMVRTIEGLGTERIQNDRPTREWLDDWNRLVAARARYADRLAHETNPPWIVPVVDGRPITARMNNVGVCAVPETLVSLK